MDRGEFGSPEKRRGRRCRVLSVVAVLLLIIVVAVVLGLILRQGTSFKSTFIDRCEQFEG